MNGFITAREAAAKWDITVRQVQSLLQTGSNQTRCLTSYLVRSGRACYFSPNPPRLGNHQTADC